MSTRENLRDRGRRMAQADIARTAADIRQARQASGLSLRAVAAAAGMSPAQVWRIERSRLAGVSVDQLARVGAVVGLEVRVRAFPGGDPLRDGGQVRIAERLRPRLHPRLSLRTEVPLPSPGGLRAWDGYIVGLTGVRATMPVEIETRFADAQAQLRKLTLKQRDADEDDVLLVLADTPLNRRAVLAAQGLLTDAFPIPPRIALSALAAGRHPGGSALIFI